MTNVRRAAVGGRHHGRFTVRPLPTALIGYLGRNMTLATGWHDRIKDVVTALEIGSEDFWEPNRLVHPPSWVDHFDTAFWLVRAVEPRTFVELGTQTGNSYSAFCQAISELGMSAKA